VARVYCDMLKGEGFGGFSEKLGPRLKRQREAGLTAMERRFVTVAPERAERPALRVVERKAPAAKAAGRGRGRPRVEGERPWEAEGVSRRTWERRRKGGGG
jgi:hypothetical protein